MGIRKFKLAAVQIGGIQRATPKEETVQRLCKLLNESADNGATLAVFPELSLTSFFPRWLIEDQEEIDSFFEKGDISKGVVKPLFDAAKERGCGFVLGYAELTDDGHRFNTCVLVDNQGQVVQKYRKAHLPGYVEPTEGIKWQQLEKKYFEYGDLGFPAFRPNKEWIDGIMGMLICNDRRWPEAWRVYALQGMEICFNGYNTTADGTALFNKVENKEVRMYHSDLSTKSNAYCNSCFAVSVAKCGVEDDQELIAGSLIVDPNGLVIAQAKTEGDEILYADIDLDETISGKQKMFDFSRHRRPELYGRLVSQKGAIPIE
ncbi:omega-amidase Nit3p [[Candida] jaroonii]|uniref:Omega-amidase Nit3p n=1 Tax=[Candida] jaroonii TaxID=467808 RepID=A0ACA9Y9Q9_9ASCO|nr:omega-amidase Nit3p [[Candida] jaroonii]